MSRSFLCEKNHSLVASPLTSLIGVGITFCFCPHPFPILVGCNFILCYILTDECLIFQMACNPLTDAEARKTSELEET
jgi:hypothetical protein